MSFLISWIFGDPEEERRSLQDVLRGHSRFACRLYEALRREHGGDLVFSPAHVQLLLAALSVGCSGVALEQAQAALQLPRERRVLERGYSRLHARLHNMKEVTMAAATRIVTPDHVRLLKDFYVTVHRHFGVAIKPSDLTRPHEQIRSGLHAWVKRSTRGKIEQLLPLGSVNSTVQMLLINAVYFDCKLEVPFVAVDTTNDLFYIQEGKSYPVKMMHQTGRFRYGEFDSLQCQALELPFKSPHLRLLMLLPFTKDGISGLEAKLPNIDQAAILENMNKQQMLVSVPSFRLQESYDICDFVDQIGMGNVIECYTKPMTNVSDCTPPMNLTQFNHEFYFELGEDRSEPGSGDAERCQNNSSATTHVFRADHPFLFSILDVSVNLIIAFGRITCQNRFPSSGVQKCVDKIEEDAVQAELQEANFSENCQNECMTQNERTSIII